MLIVKKQNKELTILESQKESFLALGYSVIDNDGNLVEAGKATEYADLRIENDTLKSEVIELKDANKKLEDKVKKLEAENKKLKAKE